MNDLPDNFAGYPHSLTELRADKSQRGSDWTPRDALIDTLRCLDDGSLKVDDLIICMSANNEAGATVTHFRAACHSSLIGLGLLARVAFLMGRLSHQR